MRDGNCLRCVGCVQHPFLVGRDEWWFYCVRVMDCLMGAMDLPVGLTTPFFFSFVLFLLMKYGAYGKCCCLNMSLTIALVTFILFFSLFGRADRLREQFEHGQGYRKRQDHFFPFFYMMRMRI
jgi:hypothetical protein